MEVDRRFKAQCWKENVVKKRNLLIHDVKVVLSGISTVGEEYVSTEKIHSDIAAKYMNLFSTVAVSNIAITEKKGKN